MNNELPTLAPYMPTVLNLLLHRMQQAINKDVKTPKYCKFFLHSICIYSLMYGSQSLYDSLESLTNGLVSMIVLNVWSFNRIQCASDSDPIAIKHMIIGATRLLLESPIVGKIDVWKSLFKSIIALVFAKNTIENSEVANEKILLDDEEDNKGFDNAYSKLAFANISTKDPSSNIVSAENYFANALSSFCNAHPGQYLMAIQSELDANEAAAFQGLLQKNNIGLI
jgi:hypothetical protein